MNEKLFEFINVTKTYNRKVTAINNISIAVEPGKIIGLLGPNGSGKTTMLKLLMSIIRPQSGEVRIKGTKVCYETRKYISFMPDREYLYDTMTISDSIKYYSEMFSDFDLQRAQDLCNKLGLVQTDYLDSLSKGNKEKVVLMLTLSRNVPIYLLDEPLGSLDPVIKHEMLTVIRESVRPDSVILISTHLINDTEEILQSAILLKNGMIAGQVNVEEIKQQGKTLNQYYLEVFTNV